MSNPADFDIKKISHLVEPLIDEMGFELVDIEYLSERGRWVLRIYADRKGGITLDDCARVSRELGNFIDVKDVIQHEYVLEVSSPGLNRPLKKEKDFLRAVGKKVKVKMFVPLKGRRRFTGLLKKYQEMNLYLEVDNNLVLLPLQDVEKANLVY
ncbi:MAG: ribosome maturation factor RimP [Deltaproteobacteria bacterium]|nr:ribosome maturation factor RimP [Deltaproteobacteria bacterium]